MRQLPKPEDLGEGLWSVPVPIPRNPLAYTLVYALESPRGPVLIDAGWQHPDSWQALTTGLAALGIAVADVYGVIVTHYHPDHSGLAGNIREASGAWIAMHHADTEMIRKFHQLRQQSHDDWEGNELRKAGATDAELAALSRVDMHIEVPAIPDRQVADGDLADLPGRKLRVVWTPGHSPGHVCLHLEESGRLFTGDHVLPGITPNIGLYPYDLPDVDPLGDFLDSLGRLAEIDAVEGLPAHEHRFADVRGRIGQIVAHHEERLAELTTILAGEPVTLWEIASRMTWNIPWADMPLTLRRLATGETAAHLRLLERRRLARLAVGPGPLRFTATETG